MLAARKHAMQNANNMLQVHISDTVISYRLARTTPRFTTPLLYSTNLLTYYFTLLTYYLTCCRTRSRVTCPPATRPVRPVRTRSTDA
eukprot:scaffold44133_cov37-Phaeocystis_antarctica.AAC.1